jgi:hypothetical protein
MLDLGCHTDLGCPAIIFFGGYVKRRFLIVALTNVSIPGASLAVWV